jgi:hypothetical protein
MSAETKSDVKLNTIPAEIKLISRRTFIEELIEKSSQVEMAVRYASFGMHVLPLHQPVDQGCSCGKRDCSSVGKHPKPENGHHGATNNVAKIIRWPHWETSNIGIAVEPTGWVVIDIDPGHGGKLDDLPLVAADLDTPTALTGGGGLHLIYRAPIGFKISQSNKRLPPGIDVRSRGYIVAPPSLHVSGKRYQWLSGKSPFELRPLPLTADLMEVLVKVGEPAPVTAAHPPATPTTGHSLRDREKGDKRSLEEIIQTGLTRISRSQPGTRNNTLNEVAFVFGIQIKIGWLSRTDAERMLADAALAKGLSEAEILKTINSGLNAGIQYLQEK